MADYTAKRIDDMEAAFGGGLKKARAELGITSFGIQIIRPSPELHRLPRARPPRRRPGGGVPGALRGSGQIEIDGERIDLSPDVLVRVGPAAKRKIYSGPEGLRILALGGAPGEAYKIKPFSELSSS